MLVSGRVVSWFVCFSKFRNHSESMASSLKKDGISLQTFFENFSRFRSSYQLPQLISKFFFLFEKGSGNNTYRCCVISGTWFLKGSDLFLFYVAHVFFFEEDGFDKKLGQRDLESLGHWNIPSTLSLEILCQSKKKRTCFFRIMKDMDVFRSFFPFFCFFFRGVSWCISIFS